MKTRLLQSLFIGLSLSLFSACNPSTHQSDIAPDSVEDSTVANPWSNDQLIQPSELAALIEDGTNIPYIYNIGPAGAIRHSIHIGATKEQKNLDMFKAEIGTTPRDASVVIYCGCCPFKDCPNIRPAFELLNEMGFTNHKLLNLTKNLKTDWIDYGYPMAE